MVTNWITNQTAKPFYARQRFFIEKEIASAEAKVCGLGQFVFHLNGGKVGDHELDPAWTDYKKLIQYVVFDVTDQLVQGENVMAAEVGNGFFIKMDEHYTFAFPPFMPPNPNPYQPYAKALILAVELTIDYADGSQEVILTDDSARVAPHKIIMSNIYGSETIDNRLEQPGWTKVDFDDSAWDEAVFADEEDVPTADLVPQFQPPVKVIKTYTPKRVAVVNGRAIYDIGQNISGIIDLIFQGPRGGQIRFYPAEKLGEDKDVDQFAKNWIMVDSCITFICSGDMADCARMTFSYFAGRYIAVECIPAEEGGRVPVMMRFTTDAITSATKADGKFICDDPRYNKIYDMIERTVEANMLGVHTDCPTIERFAWQEPNHLMASAIFYMKDGKKLWEKFLLDMRYGQHTAEDYFNDMTGGKFYPGDGLMPAQCPCYIPNVLPVPGLGDFYDIIPWGSTSILGVYWHYLFYGDVKIIEDNFASGLRYLEHLKRRVNAEGFINHGLGDWGNPRHELARENVETAFLYADAVTLAYFAQVLDKPEIEAELRAYAETVKENYNAKLLVKNEALGGYCYKCWDHPEEIYLTQATQALPLFWGLVPQELEEDIVKAFRYTLDRDGAFISGEVGLPYVIQTASKYDMNDIICRFILKKEHPSYYAFILDGETTLGEYWESNPRSHCHDMMGHIVEWYYNGIAGIRPTEPGFKAVTVRPYLPESVGEFTCTYDSASGKISVKVKETAETIRVKVSRARGIALTLDTSNLEKSGKKVIIG